MHKAVLTAAALAALSVSAVAQQSGMSGQTGQQMQPQSHALPDSSQALAGYQISPQQLNSSQVREIQQALEDRGDSSLSVNGEWGPDTEAALKNFQKSENMISQSGQLDFPTLLALGLDPLSFGLGASETTGQAPREDALQQQRMPGMPEQPLPPTSGGHVR
jgi:peptidoglycan hydrolase-like protein with peptidoglycan-binding domain